MVKGKARSWRFRRGLPEHSSEPPGMAPYEIAAEWRECADTGDYASESATNGRGEL